MPVGCSPEGNSVRSHSGATSCCRLSICRIPRAPKGFGTRKNPLRSKCASWSSLIFRRCVHSSSPRYG